MVAFNLMFLNPAAVNGFLRDAHGDVRAALICWGIVIGAFIVLRVPRKVLLSCLIIATATVGLAAAMVEMVPVQATASTAPRPQPLPVSTRAAVPRSGFGETASPDRQPY